MHFVAVFISPLGTSPIDHGDEELGLEIRSSYSQVWREYFGTFLLCSRSVAQIELLQ
jgi:hypothetical protein